MRILMTGELPPTPTGVAFHVHYMARALRELGHEVAVANVSGYASEDATWNVPPIGAGARAIPDVLRGALSPLPRGAHAAFVKEVLAERSRVGLFHYGAAFHRLVREFRPDVLHTHGAGWSYATLRLGERLGIPVVATAHGHETITSVHQADIGAMARAVLRESADVVAVSEELRELAEDVRGGPVRYVPNGVETTRFTPDVPPTYRDEWAPNGEKVIMCPKKWGVKFGYEVLARALPYVAREHPGVKLVLTGDPGLDPELHERVRGILRKEGLEKNLVTPGMLQWDRMPEALASADVVAFPSFAEAVCLAALEAMAVGKPVVASEVGGFPEIMRDGENGYMVDITGTRKSTYAYGYDIPEARVERFARRLTAVLSDADLAERLGHGARRVAEDYSWTRQAERTVKVYEDAIRGTRT